MTDSLVAPPTPTSYDIVRQAQLAWFRCGVRRRDPTWLILRACGDSTAMLTVKVLAVALPVGGLVAAVVGVAVARAQHFTTRPRTFGEVSIGVLTTLVLTIAAARAIAIRLFFRRHAARSPRA